MKYDYIFWDWNGTVLDDLDTCLVCINESLKKRKLPLVNRERYFDIFGFPVIGYYERMGFDLERESYDVLAHEFIDAYYRHYLSAPLQSGVREVITAIRKRCIPQYIFSASEKSILLQALRHHGLTSNFSDVIALDNIYAGSKLEIGKQWFSEKKLIGNCLMIGDTHHDFEVATALGMDCILFTGGHSSRKKLSALGDVVLIENLSEILDFLSSPPETVPNIQNPGTEERLCRDLAEADAKNRSFKESYRSFYNDVKNTRKTEDW